VRQVTQMLSGYSTKPSNFFGDIFCEKIIVGPIT
jgi:hypothetical protein